jgi:protein-tyrosine phosphatase
MKSDENYDDDVVDERLYREPTSIIDRLFLGCMVVAHKVPFYPEIKAVVCLGEKPYYGYPKPFSGISYLYINIDDDPDEDIYAHFDKAVDFVRSHIAAGSSVYVHCAAGVSRSATIVIAYLMAEHNMTLEEAYKHVKAKRSIIHPNWGFVNQLRRYEQVLKDRKFAQKILIE